MSEVRKKKGEEGTEKEKGSDSFDKDGELRILKGSLKKGQTKMKKKWVVYYWNLIGGSLYYYKDVEDMKPRGCILLGEMELKEKVEHGDAKFCIELKADKDVFLLDAADAETHAGWIKAIQENLKKGACPPLTKEKRQTRMMALKKNVASKAAGSGIGKKAIRSKAPAEVINLLDALKHVIAKESNQKNANKIETNIFKIGTKLYMIMQQNKLTLEQILECDEPIRKALAIFSKCADHVYAADEHFPVNKDGLRARLLEVEALLKETGTILTRLLSPYLTTKNLARVQDTVDYGSADTLMKVLLDPSLEPEVQLLVSAGEHYSQFHFYASD